MFKSAVLISTREDTFEESPMRIVFGLVAVLVPVAISTPPLLFTQNNTGEDTLEGKKVTGPSPEL
jgi:hypothetical protein